MTDQKCDYCGEKAVKTVHSYADKDGSPTDHYYYETHDKEHNTERRTDTSDTSQTN
jgi:hypothetical protein